MFSFFDVQDRIEEYLTDTALFSPKLASKIARAISGDAYINVCEDFDDEEDDLDDLDDSQLREYYWLLVQDWLDEHVVIKKEEETVDEED